MTTDTPRPLDSALRAAARGWHVFPLRPDDKRPAFPDHEEQRCTGRDPRCRAGHTGWEQRATTDPDRIRRAWSRARYGIGIACGPSGLVVLDLDVPKPGAEHPAEWRLPGVRDGGDVLAVLAEHHGARFPTETHTVRTGSGGTHLYFRHPPDGPALRNTSGRLGWLIDTRAHGGYVVAAGSVAAGRPYTLVHDADPPTLPAWLAGLLEPAPLPPQQPIAIPVAGDRRSSYLRAAVVAELERVSHSPEHGHNHALYVASVALGQLVAGRELTEQQVTTWLTQAAHQAGQKPGETARTIRSGLRVGAARPRSIAA